MRRITLLSLSLLALGCNRSAAERVNDFETESGLS